MPLLKRPVRPFGFLDQAPGPDHPGGKDRCRQGQQRQPAGEEQLFIAELNPCGFGGRGLPADPRPQELGFGVNAEYFLPVSTGTGRAPFTLTFFESAAAGSSTASWSGRAFSARPGCPAPGSSWPRGTKRPPEPAKVTVFSRGAPAPAAAVLFPDAAAPFFDAFIRESGSVISPVRGVLARGSLFKDGRRAVPFAPSTVPAVGFACGASSVSM